MNDKPSTGNTDRDRPVDTLREGPLKAAIWRNPGENGDYHTASLSRSYKDRDGNFRDTSSFRGKDMLPLSELTRRAHHDTSQRDRDNFKEQRRTSAQSRDREGGHDR